MKSKALYITLILGIIILLVVAAGLTMTLFNMQDMEKKERVTARPEVSGVSKSDTSGPAIGKIRIEATKPSTRNEPAAKPLPPTLKQPEPVAAVSKPVKPAKKSDGIGNVLELIGQATAIRSSGKQQSLKTDSTIFLNDRIQTGPSSKIKIQFSDKSILSQGENSTVVIDEYVYSAKDDQNNNFGISFTKGVCRLVTGLVAETKPENVKVRTRMATIGIRGCDLGFTASVDQDNVYVFELSGKKIVQIDTSTDGSTIMNPLTGKVIPLDQAKKKTYIIDEPGNMVSVTKGHGSKEKRLSLDDVRDIMGETSRMPAARYNIKQRPGNAVIRIQPDKAPISEKPGNLK